MVTTFLQTRMTLTKEERSQSARLYPPTHKLRGSNLKRPNTAYITQLALPKGSKRTWWTDYSGPLIWGNQETIWPLNPATLNYVATDHLKKLALPKVNHRPPNMIKPEFEYSCGRPSTIWDVAPTALLAAPTNRVKELSRHKSVPEGFMQYFTLGCGRPSTIWSPSTGAMRCPSRPRTCQLALPKKLPEDYRPPRQVQSVVSRAAQECLASPRISQLAEPKQRPDGPFREPEWPVNKGALKAESSQRTNELSCPKRLVEGYEPSKDVIWRVTAGAKSAVASSRITELSKPIVRETMDHLQFNPDAFIVSEAAKKYKASQRIEELAQPIQR